MKKIFRKIHLWLSVPFGLIVTLVCFSGAMLVFEKEVNELMRPELYFVESQSGGKPLPMEQLLEKVSAGLPDSVQVTGVTVFTDQDRAYQVSLSKPRRASMYVDQYTGEVKGRSERAPFFSFMFRLHRWLLDSVTPGGGFSWGKTIVGISTLLFVVILITGVVVWWPRTKKALRQSLKISVRHGGRRFWYDLHVAGGMYVLLFLLAMALTGLTWSFPWYRAAFYGAFGVKTEQQGGSSHGGGASQGKRPQGEQRTQGERPDKQHPQGEGRRQPDSAPALPLFVHWQRVYEELNRLCPDNKQITVSAGSASVSYGRLGNQRAADRYAFDAATGQLKEATYYRDQDKAGKLRGWIYSVHVGSWGGLLTRILAFVAALMGAVLPLTGYYLWIKRIRKHTR
ncbi:MAG: PepSY-associated TM helix domain-containing protein [Bacteroides sp.]|nr:PepSY-associated TM helix domain-containing protein [Bacteroides sp.]